MLFDGLVYIWVITSLLLTVVAHYTEISRGLVLLTSLSLSPLAGIALIVLLPWLMSSLEQKIEHQKRNKKISCAYCGAQQKVSAIVCTSCLSDFPHAVSLKQNKLRLEKPPYTVTNPVTMIRK